MSTLKLADASKTEAVVKRAFWLAWQACGGLAGMGFLQNRPDAGEDQVWENIAGRGDYPGGPSFGAGVGNGSADADYVFGRMMKLHVKFDVKAGTIEARDDKPRYDYQAWCAKYPTYAGLIEAAAKDIGVALEMEAANAS